MMEPKAHDEVNFSATPPTPGEVATASIAISLKRIADLMERLPEKMADVRTNIRSKLI